MKEGSHADEGQMKKGSLAAQCDNLMSMNEAITVTNPHQGVRHIRSNCRDVERG